jgi:hypothetical protein
MLKPEIPYSDIGNPMNQKEILIDNLKGKWLRIKKYVQLFDTLYSYKPQKSSPEKHEKVLRKKLEYVHPHMPV